VSTQQRVLTAAILLAITATPPLSQWWESSLLRHMLGQIPVLILSGVLLGSLSAQRSPSKLRPKQSEAVAAVIMAVFCLMFWMLPRWLDAAVTDPRVDAVKIGSLVLLAGFPLGWGWRRLGPLARSFIWINAISMLVALGILYLTFPSRLCNSYLIDEQPALGRTILGVAALLGLIGGAHALFGAAGNHSSAATSKPLRSLK